MLELPSLLRVCLPLLAIGCYASFIWSIWFFFHGGLTMSLRMRICSLTALSGCVAHLGGFLRHEASSIRLAIGIAFFAASACLFWWSLRTTWQGKLPIAFSAVEPDRLVRRGPYRWVRHPIYLSYLLAWVGGAIAIPSWWPWLVPMTMGLQYLSAIRQEERSFLDGPLAKEYRIYIAAVGMLLPNPMKFLKLGKYLTAVEPRDSAE